jgi:transposase-like protein
MSNGTVEIITGRERRRRWGSEEKLRIVAETHERGARVSEVAARHDVYPSLLHYWRRQVREGRLGVLVPPRLVPVRLAAPMPLASDASRLIDERHAAEPIEIVLPDGCRLRVGNEVSLATLRRVLTALRG